LLETLLLLVWCLFYHPTAADISDVASFATDVVARDAPIASAVAAAVDSSAVDVNSAVGVIWVPAVVVAPACC
jgi:hypothetical protein